MNYITQIKAFQEVAQDKQLSTGQIALYHALLYINNRCAWTEWFTVANLSLELNSGLSRNGIAKNRNILKQLRLIDFKSNGTKATQYNISDLEKTGFTSVQASVQIGVQDSVQSSVQVGVQSSGTLNKLNETKLNNKKDTKKTFTPPTVQEVREYCRERGNGVDADKWHNFYLAKGWLVGKNKMIDWQAAVRTWEEKPKKKEVILR